MSIELNPPIRKHETITVETFGTLWVGVEETVRILRNTVVDAVFAMTLTERREHGLQGPCPWEHLLKCQLLEV